MSAGAARIAGRLRAATRRWSAPRKPSSRRSSHRPSPQRFWPRRRAAFAALLGIALLGFVFIAVADVAPATAETVAPPPEPAGLWTGAMRGATPETLTGARTIDAAGVAELIASGGPLLLLDVGPADRRPPSLAPDAVWMPAHRSIPGATWLPGAGLGTDDPAYAAAFRDRIATLTGGDLDRPIVVFCQPNCWGSWNAGKRLIGLGYRRVLWAPGGVDAWQAEHEVATVRADPVWARAAPQGAPQ